MEIQGLYWNLYLKRRNAHLKTMDLTYEQSDTLQFVYFHPDYSIRDLASFLAVSHQTAQGIVSRMVKKDLLQRILCESDKRYVRLRLTSSGKDKLDRILQNGNLTAEVICAGMSEDERSAFSQLLDRAVANLKRDGKNL